MGMISTAFEVMITLSEGEPLFLEFWLDNEEVLELTHKYDLFSKVTTTKELVRNIPYGFRRDWRDDETDIAKFISGFDYDNSYKKFMKNVAKHSLEQISSIVLMTNVEQEFGSPKYKYEWIKYELSPYRVFTGVSGSESDSYSMEFLFSLKDTSAGQELQPTSSREYQVETEEIDLDQRLAFDEEQWLGKYGQHIDKEAFIEIADKTFVLSGMEALSDSVEGGIENAIMEQGGLLRSSVSGKTDYLVVDPAWAGESKVKEAIRQQAKGKNVKIILGSTLLSRLGCKRIIF